MKINQPNNGYVTNGNFFKRYSNLALSKSAISRLITQRLAPKNKIWQEEERV